MHKCEPIEQGSEQSSASMTVSLQLAV